MRLSVIVPVYNVEDYLAECLGSILGQDLDGFEVVCVDDGSTDSSGALLRSIAAEDGRVRVVSKPNGGLSSARNAGIEAARGDYLMFVDSDDALVPGACRRVMGAFDATGADMVTFGALCEPEEDASKWLVDCLSPRDVTYQGFDPAIVFEERSRPYVWRSAFRTAFVREQGLRFDETVAFGEDQIFHFASYPRAQVTAFVSDKLYRYRVTRAGSLMAQRNEQATLKLREHLRIADRVLADWHGLGLLRPYGRPMVEWVLEFVALDLFSQEEPERSRLMAELAAILDRWLPEARALVAGGAGAPLLRIVAEVGRGAPVPRTSRLAMYRYYLEQRGIRACAKRGLAMLAAPLRSSRRRDRVP